MSKRVCRAQGGGCDRRAQEGAGAKVRGAWGKIGVRGHVRRGVSGTHAPVWGVTASEGCRGCKRGAGQAVTACEGCKTDMRGCAHKGYWGQWGGFWGSCVGL